MTTRQPDTYEAAALDAVTGPIDGRVRVLTESLAAAGTFYEGFIRHRALTSDRTLDTVVIESVETGRRVAIRWASVEALVVIPTEEPTP